MAGMKLVIVVVLLAAASADRVLRIIPQDDDQVASLQAALHKMPSLDVWLEPRRAGLPVDVLVTDDMESSFKASMQALRLKPEIFIDDVQKLIREQSQSSANRATAEQWSHWTEYERLDAIYKWMESRADTYFGLATVVDAGSTYEKRRIKGLKLNLPGGKPGESKPVVFVEAGIHAREWITSATATYLINELITSKNPEFLKVVNQYDWYIFPSVNPDGYEYTHTSERLWRKTRSRNYLVFTGVDGNRNWPYQWNTVNSGGWFPSPWAENYPGPEAESEIETRSLRSFLDKVANISVYFSFHAYGQMLMYPWGYTTEKVQAHNELTAIAGNTTEYIKNHFNRTYVSGSIANTIYLASGNTIDYAYSKGIPYPFVFEQRDSKDGGHGFLLPKEQIKEASEEIVQAIRVILENVKSK